MLSHNGYYRKLGATGAGMTPAPLLYTVPSERRLRRLVSRQNVADAAPDLL